MWEWTRKRRIPSRDKEAKAKIHTINKYPAWKTLFHLSFLIFFLNLYFYMDPCEERLILLMSSIALYIIGMHWGFRRSQYDEKILAAWRKNTQSRRVVLQRIYIKALMMNYTNLLWSNLHTLLIWTDNYVKALPDCALKTYRKSDDEK